MDGGSNRKLRPLAAIVDRRVDQIHPTVDRVEHAPGVGPVFAIVALPEVRADSERRHRKTKRRLPMEAGHEKTLESAGIPRRPPAGGPQGRWIEMGR